MSKHSHKPSKQNLDKIARAQHRNNFYKKIQHICTLVANAQVFKLIPAIELEKIYDGRIRTYKIIAAKGESVENSILKEAMSLISPIAKKTDAAITPKGHIINLDDYLTVGLTFFFYLDSLKESKYAKAAELRNSLIEFYTYKDGFDVAFNKLNDILNTFSNINSEIGKQLIWFNFSSIPDPISKTFLQHIIEIHNVLPEQIPFTIDGNTRPITRVGWGFANFGVEYNCIKPSELGIDSSFATIPLNVYIQNHALLRLSERIDSIMLGLVHFQLFISLKFPKAIRDKNNNILLEYRIFDSKAGYLRADIVDGIILIRTFLFITNNGTPESEKLEEFYGLQKLDKKYLAIDKLSTFMSSDINSNDKINQLFKKTGLECLLELYEKIKPIVTKESTQPTADLMLKFLGLDKENPEP